VQTDDADRGLSNWLLFERWTLIDPDEMRRRREGWPTWRRALRPVGATLWWIGIVLGWVLPGFTDFNPWTLSFVLGFAMIACIAVCVAVGTSLEWRDRRREGRAILR
jgi:hypothetical protein